MCTYSAPTEGADVATPTDFHLVHYGARAQGRPGAILVEATAVRLDGRISMGCLSLHDDAQIPAFRRLADAIHAEGALAIIQINHSGRKGSTGPGFSDPVREIGDGGWEVIGPSAVAFSDDYRTPRALDATEIPELVDAFADAAARAVAAGFDGVQVHGAHGYLIQEFLSPFSNKRDDEWGGDFEGRTRFAREVVRAVRAAVPDAIVGFRMTATDWTQEYPADGRPGWTLAESVRLAPLLVEDGVDVLNVSTGGNVSDATMPGGPGYQVFAAAAVRQAVREDASSRGADPVPVAAVGIIATATQAEQVLVSGDADIVEIGRPLLTDPMLPHQWRRELRAEPSMPVQYERGTLR